MMEKQKKELMELVAGMEDPARLEIVLETTKMVLAAEKIDSSLVYDGFRHIVYHQIIKNFNPHGIKS